MYNDLYRSVFLANQIGYQSNWYSGARDVEIYVVFVQLASTLITVEKIACEYIYWWIHCTLRISTIAIAHLFTSTAIAHTHTWTLMFEIHSSDKCRSIDNRARRYQWRALGGCAVEKIRNYCKIVHNLAHERIMRFFVVVGACCECSASLECTIKCSTRLRLFRRNTYRVYMEWTNGLMALL